MTNGLESETLRAALGMIFEGIARLKASCGDLRKFTIDGRLVGDIGEIVAARAFEIELDQRSRALHDARTLSGREVQIKATFQNYLTFRKVPDLYLGLKLFPDGLHEVIFNGPGHLVGGALSHRKGYGEVLMPISLKRLRELNARVADGDRVPIRT